MQDSAAGSHKRFERDVNSEEHVRRGARVQERVRRFDTPHFPEDGIDDDTRRARTAGSSTAEVAVLLPSIALLLSVLLWVGMVGVAQISVQQAAREAARELARGEDSESFMATVKRVAGDQATGRQSGDGNLTRVIVAKPVSMGGIEWLTIQVSAEASVLNETP
ncbi:TadE family type IV pilus minor pilin [Neomicrococcus aestuarii]|nr:TadE family type IV pilus minor pilin [Neomicrococcus aestuarii]